MPGQFASWPVSGRVATRLFCQFRVVLLPGPGAAATNPAELALSSLELYGYLSTGATAPASSVD